MAIKNPKDVFVLLLSGVKNATERSASAYDELGEAAQHPEIKEALEARAFISKQNLEKIDQVFKMIGERPTPVAERIHDIIVEDFRKELSEIQSPEARRLYVLAKINHLIHARIAEYIALIAAADATGYFGAGVLLESCLADHMAFAERTKRLMRNVVEARIAARAAGA
jgi:ferritin-like metal-binding protein YciE